MTPTKKKTKADQETLIDFLEHDHIRQFIKDWYKGRKIGDSKIQRFPFKRTPFYVGRGVSSFRVIGLKETHTFLVDTLVQGLFEKFNEYEYYLSFDKMTIKIVLRGTLEKHCGYFKFKK